jgi:hypothetical protein
VVFARLSERRDERAVLLIAEAGRDVARLRDTRGGSVRLLEAIDTLASTGAVAARAFLRMASDGTLTRAEVVDALARTEGAAGAIAGFVRSRPRGIQDGVALAAIAALQPKGALPLLERRCVEQRERRKEALEVLASYGDRDALEALVRIAASGRIPSAEIEAPIRMVLATSRDAGRTVVEEATRAGRRVELLVLQQILASTPTSASAPALIALGGSHLLPSSDRRWSILLAGETGISADAEAVAQLFWSSRSADRDVRAACLIAIQNLGGPAHLERFAETLPRRVAERVIALLATRESKDRPASTLSRLARELETALAPLAP